MTITIGQDQGSYSINVGTNDITISDIDFTPTVEGLLYIINTTKNKLYFAQAEPRAKDVTIAADGDNWTLTYSSIYPELEAGDKLHIQFYRPINPQRPLEVDGDSIYVKDLDLEYCDNGNFSGSVSDYFNSLKTVNSDSTANNPKTIKLWFKRSTYSHSIGFGCDNLAKGFGSSITIKLLGSGESVRYTKTFTPSDPNSFLAEFGSKAFNGVLLEFNTANEVCLSNLTIQKSTEGNMTLHGTDPDGDVQDVNVTKDGYLAVTDNSDGLAIAEGDVTGKTFIHKFGNTPDFDQSDGQVTIWDGADDSDIDQMIYQYSTTADIDSLVSSNNSDTQDIEVQGLDSNYDLVLQTITLTGQTRAALTTSLIRVFRLKNVGATDIVGNVYCYVNSTITLGVPDDPTKVRAVINNGNNQTEMAVYTIPNGHTGYMRSFFAATAGSSKTSNYIIKLRARPFGQVFQLKHRSSLAEVGTSHFNHVYIEPEVFSTKTDIEMTVEMTAAGATGASVSAGFDIVLVEN